MAAFLRRRSPEILMVALFGIACTIYWPFQIDDAYISFVYARNWVLGQGLTYNGLNVEGYSNFLWTVLIAGFLRLNVEPMLAARLLSLVSGAITLIVIYKLNTRLNPGLGNISALLAILSVGLSAPFLLWTVGGLETIFFTCLVSLCIYTEVLDNPDRPYASALFGLAAALTRPEGVMVFPILLALRVGQKRGAVVPWLVSALLFAIPYSLFILWRYSTYGYPVPNTAYLKLEPTPDTARFAAEWLLDYFLLRPVFAGLLIAGLVAAGRSWISAEPGWLSSAVISLAFVGFILFSGRDWMPHHRFLVPVMPLFGLYIGRILATFKNQKTHRVVQALALGSILIELSLSLTLYRPLAVEFGRYMEGLIQAGRWINATTAPEAVIAVVDAGALAYYGERPTIDILGLNNEHIAHTPEKNDPAYVLAQAPVLIQLHIAFSPSGELVEPIQQVAAHELIHLPLFEQCYAPDLNRPWDPFYPYMFIWRCP